MTPEQAVALLIPFPEEMIGKLPRITCQPCSKSQTKVCNEHRKIKCDGCGNWISERHIHLDYVGHAATTKRLLEVDPEWTWEPFAVDANGAPALANGGLWIRMTVCGVSRLGWGDGPDIKQMISDAIRNAAMRFGVALDLWSKEDLRAHDEVEAGHGGSGARTAAAGRDDGRVSSAGDARGSRPSPASATSPALGESQGAGVASTSPPAPDAAPAISKNRLGQLQSKLVEMQAAGFKVAPHAKRLGLPLLNKDCTPEQLDQYAALLNEHDTNLNRVPV